MRATTVRIVVLIGTTLISNGSMAGRSYQAEVMLVLLEMWACGVGMGNPVKWLELSGFYGCFMFKVWSKSIPFQSNPALLMAFSSS